MDPVNAQGMFDGARVGMGDDGGEEDVDEYFDDAGDIGYLPADHVSFTKIRVLQSFEKPLLFYLTYLFEYYSL